MPSGDFDFWTAPAQANDLLFAFVDTQNSGGSVDSTLTVFDTDGQTILEFDDDDGPGGTSVVAGAQVSQDGDASFKVQGFGAATLTPYELYTRVVDPTDFQTEGNNDTPATADPITASLVIGDFSAADDDYFSFSAAEGDRIVVMVDQDPNDDGMRTDVHLDIIDTDTATILASGDDVSFNGDAAIVSSTPTRA